MKFVKLGEIADFVRNGASIKQQNGALGIPITRIETISNDIFNYDRLGYADITSNDYENYYLKDYDILMSHINSLKYLGRTVIYRKTNNTPIIHGMNLLCIRINPAKYNPYFFYYYSKSDLAKHYYWLHTKKSVNQASIMASAIKDMPIPLVDKSTQQKIVDVLDNINSLIKTKETELAQLDSLVQSQFAQMFGVCNSYSTLEDLASLITKGASPNWQGVSYVDDGVLFITSENVREGFIDYSKEKFLEKKINDLQPRSVLNYGDILINIVGASIGRTAMFDKTVAANINQAVSLVRIDKNKVNLKYLVIFLNSKSAINQYLLMKKGGARDNLSLKNIADLQIPLPPIELQNKFASFVQQVDKSKSILNAQILQLKELLNSKMDEYFSC